MHRLERPGQERTTWEAGRWNETASHRYSEPGVGAVYGGTTKKTALEEVRHYDDKVGYDSSLRKYKYKDVKIDDVLDLTDPATRDHLGVSLDDLTKTGPGQYDITHEIGRSAKEMGYKGIVAPSARNPGGANVIVFGGF